MCDFEGASGELAELLDKGGAFSVLGAESGHQCLSQHPGSGELCQLPDAACNLRVFLAIAGPRGFVCQFIYCPLQQGLMIFHRHVWQMRFHQLLNVVALIHNRLEERRIILFRSIEPNQEILIIGLLFNQFILCRPFLLWYKLFQLVVIVEGIPTRCQQRAV